MAAKATSWLRRRADDVAVLLLSAMFIAFIVQIFMRYVLNWPVGWSVEVCLLAWLWGILWGSAFVLRDEEEIRFDLLYHSVGAGTRRVFRAISAVAVVSLYAISLPATISYVAFMKIERSAYMEIRFDYLFSIYILFALAVIGRHAAIFWRSVRPGRGRANARRAAGPAA